jgi:hypothetical protein
MIETLSKLCKNTTVVLRLLLRDAGFDVEMRCAISA